MLGAPVDVGTSVAPQAKFPTGTGGRIAPGGVRA